MNGCLALALFVVVATASAGTPHVTRDINTLLLPVNSDPTPLGMVGNTLYFSAMTNAATGTRGLYKSDGTGGGTVLVKAFAGPGPVATDGVPAFIAAGTKAYFAAEEDATGQEVWVTDGTSAGTHIVQDMNPGTGGGVQLVGLLGSDLVFAAAQGGTSWQVFRTDGAPAAVVPLTNFSPSTTGLVTNSLVVNGKIYMAISGGSTCCVSQGWVSDGSLHGATLIAENPSAPEDMYVGAMAQLGSAVLLVAYTQSHGTEIVRVDAATNALTFLEPINDGASYAAGGTQLVVMNGHAYYGGGANSDFELWRTDGTLGGTGLAVDISPGPMSGMGGGALIKLGNRLVFPGNFTELWSSDGTPQGTQLLLSAPGATPQLVGVAGSRAYFAIGGGGGGPPIQLLSTDGTVTGTQIVPGMGALDVYNQNTITIAGDDTATFISGMGIDTAQNMYVKQLFKYDPQNNQTQILENQDYMNFRQPIVFTVGRAYFRAMDGANGTELWESDGTLAGTRLLKNVQPELTSAGSLPNWLTDVDGKLFFVADDGVHGREIWQSDGTEAGTQLAFDVRPGADSADPKQLFAWKGSLYFIAIDDTGQYWFMRTTGVGGPLQKLAAVAAQPIQGESYFPLSVCVKNSPVEFNGKLYLAAQDAAGLELWSTDGTAAGTTRVTDLASGGGWSSPCALTVFKGRLWFRANDGGGGRIFSTDGTAAGTAPLQTDTAPTGTSAAMGVLFNNALYFTAANSLGQSVTWKSDGTAAGTQPLMQGSAQPFWGSPIGVANGKLIMTRPVFANGFVTAFELWVSDGTAAGTVQIPDARLSFLSATAVLADRVYFANSNDTAGLEPWASDGTAAGTVRLADLNPAGDSYPTGFVDFHGVVYLQATDPVRGAGLWRTNGTPAGTVYVGDSVPWTSPVPQIAPTVSGQNLFFVGPDAIAGQELSVLRNDAPVAASDSATVVSGASVAVTVASNDTDADGTVDAASVHVVAAPAHGTATAASNGGVTYTATAGYFGADSFTYSVADNQGNASNTATVTVTVTAAPPPSDGGGKKGGGGALSGWDVLLLGGLLLLRTALRPRRLAVVG